MHLAGSVIALPTNRVWQGLCLKLCVDFEWRLRGGRPEYAELGNGSRVDCRVKCAIENAISSNQPEVLQIASPSFDCGKKDGRAAFETVQPGKLCQVAPHCSAGFLHAWVLFCTSSGKNSPSLRNFLLKGGRPHSLREPIYYYNMGLLTTRFLGNPKSGPGSICSPASKMGSVISRENREAGP